MEDDIELLRLRAKAKLKLQEQEAQTQQEQPQEEPGLLEKASRALNFESGLGRGALATAIEPLVGKELVTGKEITSGTVPSSEELAKKAGVDLTYMYPAFARNLAKLTGQEGKLQSLAGATADVYLDPATALVPMLQAAQVGKTGKALAAYKGLETLLNPIGETAGVVGAGIKKGGEKAYKSAFKKIDEAIAERTGKGLSGVTLSDILHSEKFGGNFKAAIEKVNELAGKAGEELGRFREYAANRGVMSVPSDFSQMEQEIARLKQVGTPDFLKKAEYLQTELDALKQAMPKYPSEVAQTQATLRSYLPKNAWALSSEDALKTRGIKGQMSSLASAEEKAMAEKLRPEEVADFLANKERYGILQETQDIAKEAKKEANRLGADPGALGLFAGTLGLAKGDPTILAALAAKKARDVARLSSVKTKGGLMLEDLGSLIQKSSEQIPPQVWLQMIQSKNKEQGQ